MTTIRRFTLRDAMVLVMAAAIGLTFARWHLSYFQYLSTLSSHNYPVAILPQPPLHVSRWIHELVWLVGLRAMVIYPSVMTFSIAILILSLAQPRPRVWRVFRQPGVIACAAAVLSCLSTFLVLIPTSMYMLTFDEPAFGSWGINYWHQTARSAGLTVSGAWIALALGGYWRSGRNWIDRMGRVLGICWLGALALETASMLTSL